VKDALTFPPIEELLPHRGTMLLLDRITNFDTETIYSEYTPRAHAWYCDERGHMPAWIGIELMAQTIAAQVGLVKRSQAAPPKQGVLLGTRSYAATQPFFMVGQTLCIQSTLIFLDDSGLGAYECSICVNDLEVASATLKVFEPDNFETFLQTPLS
jgi:predicted hotdog family 3-hydroxylacyl-ACP dehydratase